MALALLFSLQWSVFASHCPAFSCATTLQDNMCALLIGEATFKVNSQGCDGSHSCSAFSLLSWAGRSASTASSGFPCSPVVPASSASVSGEWGYAPCPSRKLDKDFKSGSLVITCSSRLDCLLMDNTTTTCECVLRTDGLGICQSDISSQAFSGYWEECGSLNQLSSEIAYNYWSLFATYWTLEQSNIDCMSIFIEQQALDAARSVYNAGATAFLAGITLLI